jgi:ABC-2 type transport system permease protein
MTRPSPELRSDVDLLRRWIVARVKLTLRTPRAVVFTFAMPLLLLVLFSALNMNTRVAAAGDIAGKVNFAQFYTPSIGIFGLMTACYTAMILGLSNARESGLLKRVRATPLPMPIYLTAWLTGGVLTGIAAVVLMFIVAIPAFGVHIYAHTLLPAIVTLVVGAVALASLGLAVGSLAKSADQAMPIAQLTMLPLSFISGVFYPVAGAPTWLIDIAKVFPLYHLINAFDACFVPQNTGSGWNGTDLLVLAIWGLVGIRVAARRFAREGGGGRLAMASQ